MSFGVRSTSIRISSRAVLDLLAGTTDPSRFSEDHWPERFATSTGSNNLFAAAAAQGMTIQAVKVERREDEDDDWITFELFWGIISLTTQGLCGSRESLYLHRACDRTVS